MSNPDSTRDPSAIFNEWVTQWERAVDDFSNQLMGTDDFSKAVNSVQNTQLQLQRVFAEMMARHLANLNMPSRQDVLDLGESLQAIETRLGRIETRLDRLASSTSEQPVKPKGPPRTRRPAAKKQQTK
jgi:hypothetical protein